MRKQGNSKKDGNEEYNSQKCIFAKSSVKPIVGLFLFLQTDKLLLTNICQPILE
jgi:hypothetical protein